MVVTNRKALLSKYGNKGLATIDKALSVLIAADKKRGIKTKVIHLDDKRTMKKLGGKIVVSVTDPRENKEAIDAVFKFFNPHYLMILGAPRHSPSSRLRKSSS